MKISEKGFNKKYTSKDVDEFCSEYNIKLNKQQQSAVGASEGATLLAAVPGSGKTTVLIARLGYLILRKNISPENILSMTYTKAASNDMKNRFASVFGIELADKIRFCTINSLCFNIIAYCSRLIGKNSYSIISEYDKHIILKNIYQKLTNTYPTEADIIDAETNISYIKNMMLNPDEIEEIKSEDYDIKAFFSLYNFQLKHNRMMDYDDQMIYALNIMRKNPQILEYFQNRYKYINVDEVQDTSRLQHAIIKLLTSKYNNIFMVGDEDQSIYGFRAAYPQALMNFKNDYADARVLFLEQNYRSTKNIVNAARKFIEKNTDRYNKKMFADNNSGNPIERVLLKSRNSQYYFLINELRGGCTDTAILYRDNDCVLPLVDLLIAENIPYNTPNIKMTFFTNRIVQDISQFFKFAVDEFDASAFMQIYYKSNLGLRKEQAELICNLSKAENINITKALLNFSGASADNKLITNSRAFENLVKYIKTHKPYESICEICSHSYNRYINQIQADRSKIEILKLLSKSEKTPLDFLKKLSKMPETISNNSSDNPNSVILSTIHSSKGLEYDTVYLLDVYDGILPSVSYSDTIINPELMSTYSEERRLFYVAVTRAKNRLIILKVENFKTTFIDEISPKKENNISSDNIPKIKIGNNKLKLTAENIEMYSVGKRVVHKIFGGGVIKDITKLNSQVYNGTYNEAVIEFDSGSKRTFWLETLISNGLIHPETDT